MGPSLGEAAVAAGGREKVLPAIALKVKTLKYV